MTNLELSILSSINGKQENIYRYIKSVTHNKIFIWKIKFLFGNIVRC